MRMIPIDALTEHQVRGETRWTGRLAGAGGPGDALLILAVGGRLLAVRNRCPHRDIALLRGYLDEAGGTLECPSHGLLLEFGGSDLAARPVVVQDGCFYLETE